MDKTKLHSQALDLLRFPLAIAVVCVHVFNTRGLEIQGDIINWNNFPLFLNVNYLVDAFIRKQSVPIFYFIAGYVFFLNFDGTKSCYYKKLKNRIKSLFIPYMIWNTIAIGILSFTLLSPFAQYTAHSSTFTPTISNFLSCYWMYDGRLAGIESLITNDQNPLNGPLWFVRDLMIVILLVPIIKWLLEQMQSFFIWILGFLFLSEFNHIQGIYFPCTALLFFSWGAYFSLKKLDILTIFGRLFKTSTILYILLGLLYILSIYFHWGLSDVAKKLNLFIGLIFAYNMAAWLLKEHKCNVNSYLASASFFIYVSHYLICGKIVKLLFLFVRPTNDFSILIVFLLAIVLTIGILLAIFFLMRKYTPHFFKIIVGRK